MESIKGYGITSQSVPQHEGPPAFLIKYDRSPSDAPHPAGMPSNGAGECEEVVYGGESEVIEAVRRLVEQGRTTPERVRVYANLNPIITTSVQFAPQPGRTSR